MPRYTKLTKEARNLIKDTIREKSIFDKDQVKNLIQPHQIFNPAVAKEKELGELASRIIASVKDEQGVRDIYSLGDKNRPGVFVNVVVTDDIEALDQANNQIAVKYEGLNRSRKKIAAERQRLLGQISFTDDGKNNNTANN